MERRNENGDERGKEEEKKKDVPAGQVQQEAELSLDGIEIHESDGPCSEDRNDATLEQCLSAIRPRMLDFETNKEADRESPALPRAIGIRPKIEPMGLEQCEEESEENALASSSGSELGPTSEYSSVAPEEDSRFEKSLRASMVSLGPEEEWLDEADGARPPPLFFRRGQAVGLAG